MSEHKITGDDWQDSKSRKRSRGRSVFGPVVLIAAGAFFLLVNLGVLPQPDWLYALSFWPLFLIFVGLNILAIQVPAPGGTFLSLLVSVGAVGAFGYLLFAGQDNLAVQRLGIDTPSATVTQVPFSVPVGSATAAEIELDLSNYPVDVLPSAADGHLLDGSIWTATGLVLDAETDADTAQIKVGEESGVVWFFDPASWFADTGGRSWQIAISDQLPIDLTVDGGNGPALLELEGLTLWNLAIDAGNGSLSATLPDGEYDGRIEGGNGSMRITLPSGGRQQLEVNGANGGMTFLLPDGMPARVVFDRGNGGISVDERFELVSGDREDGVYETTGYEDAAEGILIELETGNGAFRLLAP